jgi:LuxR family maltose regulon positive regulatory protein
MDQRGGYPDPARFAAEFSGSERTVADYLLAEVLDRQSEQVRHLFAKLGVHGRTEAVARPRPRPARAGPRTSPG